MWTGRRRFTRISRLVFPIIPLIKAALADLKAASRCNPLVHNAKEGAAEALYGLGGAGTPPGRRTGRR